MSRSLTIMTSMTVTFTDLFIKVIICHKSVYISYGYTYSLNVIFITRSSWYVLSVRPWQSQIGFCSGARLHPEMVRLVFVIGILYGLHAIQPQCACKRWRGRAGQIVFMQTKFSHGNRLTCIFQSVTGHSVMQSHNIKSL